LNCGAGFSFKSQPFNLISSTFDVHLSALSTYTKVTQLNNEFQDLTIPAAGFEQAFRITCSRSFLLNLFETRWFWKLKFWQPRLCYLYSWHTWFTACRMKLIGGLGSSLPKNEFAMQPKSYIPQLYASILPFKRSPDRVRTPRIQTYSSDGLIHIGRA
jgi:hypothetical protein